MFKFVRKHSQPIGDHPLTDTLLVHIAWEYKPSQPIGDHPLWPCPLRVVSNFVRHSYVKSSLEPPPSHLAIHLLPLCQVHPGLVEARRSLCPLYFHAEGPTAGVWLLGSLRQLAPWYFRQLVYGIRICCARMGTNSNPYRFWTEEELQSRDPRDVSPIVCAVSESVSLSTLCLRTGCSEFIPALLVAAQHCLSHFQWHSSSPHALSHRCTDEVDPQMWLGWLQRHHKGPSFHHGCALSTAQQLLRFFADWMQAPPTLCDDNYQGVILWECFHWCTFWNEVRVKKPMFDA